MIKDKLKTVAEALKPFLYDLNGPDLHIRAAQAAIAAMTPEAAPKREPVSLKKCVKAYEKRYDAAYARDTDVDYVKAVLRAAKVPYVE